jgi:hypothetical protein
MSADIGNMLKMMNVLGDDGFVDALTDVEGLVEDVNETLDRVERIEGEAEAAVKEANEALNAVDHRLAKFDETISLLEAKIEAGFSVGFLFFALNQYLAGEFLLAAGLGFMGMLGASSLVVTIVTLPQVRRLRRMSRFENPFGRDESTDGTGTNGRNRGRDRTDSRDRDTTDRNESRDQNDDTSRTDSRDRDTADRDDDSGRTDSRDRDTADRNESRERDTEPTERPSDDTRDRADTTGSREAAESDAEGSDDEQAAGEEVPNMRGIGPPEDAEPKWGREAGRE